MRFSFPEEREQDFLKETYPCHLANNERIIDIKNDILAGKNYNYFDRFIKKIETILLTPDVKDSFIIQVSTLKEINDALTVAHCLENEIKGFIRDAGTYWYSGINISAYSNLKGENEELKKEIKRLKGDK